MAVQKQDGLHTDVALGAVDLTGKENRFCRRDATGKLVISGAGEYIDGVISEGKPADKHTSFNTPGNEILRVLAGSALAINDYVSSDAEGRAVVGTANVIGRVRKTVSAADVVAEIIPGRVIDTTDNI
jgi:hypothetical protein